LQGDLGLCRRFGEEAKFSDHNNSVSSLDWSTGGEILVSAGLDKTLRIYSASQGFQPRTLRDLYTNSILSCKFIPFSSLLLTAGAHSEVLLTDLEKEGEVRGFLGHNHDVKALVVDRFNPYVFLTGGDDGTVRQFDIRSSSNSTGNLLVDGRLQRRRTIRSGQGVLLSTVLNTQLAASIIALNPRNSNEFVVSGDAMVRVYDRRMQAETTLCSYFRKLLPQAVKNIRHSVVTGLAYDHTGSSLTVSYQGDKIYTFDMTKGAQKEKEQSAATTSSSERQTGSDQATRRDRGNTTTTGEQQTETPERGNRDTSVARAALAMSALQMLMRHPEEPDQPGEEPQLPGRAFLAPLLSLLSSQIPDQNHVNNGENSTSNHSNNVSNNANDANTNDDFPVVENPYNDNLESELLPLIPRNNSVPETTTTTTATTYTATNTHTNFTMSIDDDSDSSNTEYNNFIDGNYNNNADLEEFPGGSSENSSQSDSSSDSESYDSGEGGDANRSIGYEPLSLKRIREKRD